jgi:hypothetical protein
LEQKIPNLVAYPLSDFRVHVVEPSTASRIPNGTVVIVIDFGDSALAPHQCNHGGGSAQKYTYYYRQAGHSTSAPHFYLELLRQRLVNPLLRVTEVSLSESGSSGSWSEIHLSFRVTFHVENQSRVAAYKWQLNPLRMDGFAKGRGEDDLSFRRGSGAGIRIGDTAILPGCTFLDEFTWSVILRPLEPSHPAFRDEIDCMLVPTTLEYRIATETSPGEEITISLGTQVDPSDLASQIAQRFLTQA